MKIKKKILNKISKLEDKFNSHKSWALFRLYGNLFAIISAVVISVGLFINMVNYFIVQENVPSIKERIEQSKIDGVEYKIPSSTIAVGKFITYPMLNGLEKTVRDDYLNTHAILSTISRISSDHGEFDAGDCRIGVEGYQFDQDNMRAKFGIKSLSCTDNEGYAYAIESKSGKNYIGYLSEESNIGNDWLSVVKDDKLMTADIDKKYIAMFIKPVNHIELKGRSLFGRF